jgi:hypothetical protein
MYAEIVANFENYTAFGFDCRRALGVCTALLHLYILYSRCLDILRAQRTIYKTQRRRRGSEGTRIRNNNEDGIANLIMACIHGKPILLS